MLENTFHEELILHLLRASPKTEKLQNKKALMDVHNSRLLSNKQ